MPNSTPKPAINLIFQIETKADLQNALNHLSFNEKLLEHSPNLSNIKEAYRISDESKNDIFEFVENNTTDLHEYLFDFIVIHTIDLGIAGESKVYPFEFDHESKKYKLVQY